MLYYTNNCVERVELVKQYQSKYQWSRVDCCEKIHFGERKSTIPSFSRGFTCLDTLPLAIIYDLCRVRRSIPRFCISNEVVRL